MLGSVKSLWRNDGAKLAGVLFIAGLVALLFNTGTGTATVSVKNPAGRKAMADLTFSDLNARPWRLVDQRGKVVLVNVWATWCPPCRQETPGLVAIANEYRGKPFEIVGASMDDSVEPVRQFIDRFHVPYTVVMPPQDSPINGAVEALPTSFLIDREGRVAQVYTGAISQRALRADIDRLLAEP
jgi:cytochrome c biogenesis protein CcmG, thiol:disulfide interchange protein DsbE